MEKKIHLTLFVFRTLFLNLIEDFILFLKPVFLREFFSLNHIFKYLNFLDQWIKCVEHFLFFKN